MARFWDVREGSVKIGGVNVKEIAKEVLIDTAWECPCFALSLQALTTRFRRKKSLSFSWTGTIR
ncbi:hypothetical protein D7V90_13160 [bacterium 1xD42-87]|nr:hypothetical protein D7V90_13160 [bacterium 1xD42-87]